jgi:uncharacterized membrane protein YhaH (DUF805 family)
VTAFQIAIAISAISILTRRKRLWYGSLVLTGVGLVFFILGFFPELEFAIFSKEFAR